MDESSNLTILRCQRVLAKTGLPRSSMYALIALGKFPSQILLGARSVGWLENEVDLWISDRVIASREVPAAKGATPLDKPAKAPTTETAVCRRPNQSAGMREQPKKTPAPRDGEKKPD